MQAAVIHLVEFLLEMLLLDKDGLTQRGALLESVLFSFQYKPFH